MTLPRNNADTTRVRLGNLTVYHRRDLDPRRVLDALDAPGETLKVSEKFVTRRVGPWVLKESRPQSGLGVLKRTVQRRRYRQAWTAALFLEQHDVPVARPHAFVERRHYGAILANTLITDYLEGCCNVEQHAAHLARDGAEAHAIAAFLERLADAVNTLTATGAYHADLSGKNIFTRAGEHFYFIDLDGVVLNRPYTSAQRMKNHVQLYDSFCDLWGPDLLGPFVRRMYAACPDADAWTQAVHEGQRKRRAEHDRRQQRTRRDT